MLFMSVSWRESLIISVFGGNIFSPNVKNRQRYYFHCFLHLLGTICSLSQSIKESPRKLQALEQLPGGAPKPGSYVVNKCNFIVSRSCINGQTIC